MFKRIFPALLLVCTTSLLHAQDGDFCGAITAILRDAPSQFRDVRSPEPDNSEGNVMYKCQIKVPGTFIARFVQAMGLFYEGGIKQARTAEELQPEFEKYKAMLNQCLSEKGYIMREVPNHNKGMEQFKKILFMPDFKSGDTPSPGHAALEINQNKMTGLYTLIVFIYEK